jgi:twitching motility protein PilT
MRIEDILKRVIAEEASDLHLRVPNKPVLRIQGGLRTMEDLLALTDDEADNILSQITTRQQASAFVAQKELDFTYNVPGLARFRVNVMWQQGSLSIAFRLIPFRVPSIDELGLPQILKDLVLRPRGLILITGQTGMGKSTTLAAMVNHLNENATKNIIIIEEPIEFIHQNNKCLIAQREVGRDTDSFAIALKHALRHDPDVIVLGEMRDLETISTAITAAETGHLVLGTMHTYNAAQSIDRMIDIFHPDQQQQIRVQLSQILEAVISQVLLPRTSGGRIAAFEVMTATLAVRNLIRDKKLFQLSSVIQLGSKEGMQTMDQELANLVRDGIVEKDVAAAKTMDREQFEKWLTYPDSRKKTAVNEKTPPAQNGKPLPL